MNSVKTAILLAALTGLMMVIGKMMGGQSGMIFAFLLAMIMNFGSYWFSDKIVLAMYRAEELSPHEAPELFSIIRNLCRRADLPMPRVYMIPSESPNAFATGRDPRHAAVAVTKGILRLMTSDELEGVLAHELAHVKDRDILISSIAATLAGAIMLLASMARWAAIFGGFGRSDDEEGSSGIFGLLFIAILAPIAATLIQLAISRSREYMADSRGALIAGNPEGLANALEKLGYASARLPLHSNPATAHLFIVNPLSGGALSTLFSTHPPIEERIKRLRAMR